MAVASKEKVRAISGSTPVDASKSAEIVYFDRWSHVLLATDVDIVVGFKKPTSSTNTTFADGFQLPAGEPISLPGCLPPDTHIYGTGPAADAIVSYVVVPCHCERCDHARQV